MGYGQVLRGKHKSAWLLNRFWCERLRQLHFQFIVNNLDLTAEAVTDPVKLDALRSLRARHLAALQEDMRYAPAVLHRLEANDAEDRPWVSEAWIAPPPTPKPSQSVVRVLAVLKKYRFGVQRDFGALKLQRGLHSPATRATWISNGSDGLTGLLLLTSATTGLAHAFAAPGSLALVSLSALSAVLAASVVALRVLNEGLQLTSDTERYRWYLASVSRWSVVSTTPNWRSGSSSCARWSNSPIRKCAGSSSPHRKRAS